MIDASWQVVQNQMTGFATEIQALIDNIIAVETTGALTAPRVTAVIAKLTYLKDRMLTVGTDPNNPIPPQAPGPGTIT